MAAEWKMKNGKWKIIVCALRTILIHFRRKYHNFQFSIAKQLDKLKFDESLVVKYAGAHIVRPGKFSQSVI
jgi:hypothetical protein